MREGKNMHITIVAWGGHGDIRPYIALALGLKQAGYVVKFVTTPDREEFITSYGFNSETINCENFDVSWQLPGHNPFHITDAQKRTLQPFKSSYLNELWRVCQQAEVIIFNTYGFASYYIAEKLGIPCYAACVQPHHQTHAFTNPYVPIIPHLGNTYNRLSYLFFDQLLWQSVRVPINEWRQETLNLSPLPRWSGITRRMYQQKLPFLYSYSPSVLPKPSDWPDWAHVTGYWFLDRAADWQPPTDLIKFLAAGEPPIYIEIRHDEVEKEMVLKVLEKTGLRAVVRGMGFDPDDIDGLPDKVFPINSIPHEWLFPQMAAVVHHGGTGTTMSSLRAGVPTVTVPLEGDHFLWGHRVAKLGIGPQPIWQKQISAETIAAAIQVAISDKTMQTRAAAMGKRIQSENGVQVAVEILNRYLLASKRNFKVLN